MDDIAREEAKRLLAERSPDADIMREGPPGSDKKYIELALEVDDKEVINAVADKFNNSPLHLAALRGQHDLAMRLIKAGADVNALNIINFNALHFAVRHKSPSVELVEMLFKAGVDHNVADKDGAMPLHVACLAGKAEMAELLLKNGANRDAQDRSGRTPLYCAVQGGYGELANKLLVEYHCDPTVKTYKNRTVYHAAAMANDKKTLV